MGIQKAVVNLMPGILVRIFAAPYVAGKGLESGLKVADTLYENDNLYSTIDLLGEAIYEHDEVEQTVDLYLRMVDSLKDRKFASISIKPTQLGIFESEEYCLGNMRRVIEKADPLGIHVTIDMEDNPYTDITLEFFQQLRNEFEHVGTVLQSRLFRTRDDVMKLPDKCCKIRMCIGIYNEPKEIALQKKPEMKEEMFQLVQLLLERGHYPEVATHDEPLMRRCMAYFDAEGVARDKYEYQMLMGVPRKKLQKELIDRGEICRLYVPFAEQWKRAVAYMKRRLAASPMMAAYAMKNMIGKVGGR